MSGNATQIMAGRSGSKLRHWLEETALQSRIDGLTVGGRDAEVCRLDRLNLTDQEDVVPDVARVVGPVDTNADDLFHSGFCVALL